MMIRNPMQFYRGFLQIATMAYYFAILPSVLYAVALEMAFRRSHVAPNSAATVILSTGLGLVAGYCVGASFMLLGAGWNLGGEIYFGTIGAGVGTLLGGTIRAFSTPNHGFRDLAIPAALTGLLFIPYAAFTWAQLEPDWVCMIALATGEFVALKLFTLAASDLTGVPWPRRLAYLCLWPGMNAVAFLAGPKTDTERPHPGEWIWAFSKLLGGAVVAVIAARSVDGRHLVVATLAGLVGLIFVFHFGVLHLASCFWRRAGYDAPPIMQNPIGAESLAKFWGGRWNRAFADAGRRFIFRPTVRRLGARGAEMLVFVVSGLVHESVISLPAGGGWGGPTVYFLLQGGGVLVEKSRAGTQLGLSHGVRGWGWMFLCTVLPLPLLTHPPFIERVAFPLIQALKEILP